MLRLASLDRSDGRVFSREKRSNDNNGGKGTSGGMREREKREGGKAETGDPRTGRNVYSVHVLLFLSSMINNMEFCISSSSL